MGGKSGSGGGGTTTTYSKVEPIIPKEIRPFLTDILQEGQSRFEQGKSQPFDRLERKGQRQILRQLPGLRKGAYQLNRTALGLLTPDFADILNQDPTQRASALLQGDTGAQLREASFSPIRQEFLENVLPNISSDLAIAGQGGGTRGSLLQGAAGQKFADSLFRAEAGLRNQLFNETLAAQQSALSQIGLGAQILPTAQDLLLKPGQIKANIGEQRFNRPQDILNQYARIVQGGLAGTGTGQSGTTTQTASGFNPRVNPIASGIGTGLLGAYLGSQILNGAILGTEVAPGVGTAIGGLLGLLGGAFI